MILILLVILRLYYADNITIPIKIVLQRLYLDRCPAVGIKIKPLPSGTYMGRPRRCPAVGALQK